MDGKPPEDPGTGYLRLRSLLFDRVTGLAAYPAVLEDVRNMLEGRRQVGVLHFQLVDVELVESLYGWQVFDRILARAAAALHACLGRELPPGSVAALNAVSGDRLLVFVPQGAEGREVEGAFLGGAAGAVAARLEQAFEGDEFRGLSPRLQVRGGYALISEDPFYRFERRVQGAIEEARTLSERRRHRHERAAAAELKRILVEASLSAVFQPIVDLLSGEVVGHEGFVRGPKDSSFASAAVLFQVSESEGVSGDLDRLARRTVLREAAGVAGRGLLFLNVLPGGLSDPEWRGGLVRELLAGAAIAPAQVVLEVSERAADAHASGLQEACRLLRGEGFRLGLDDVGTGFSSLASVERMRPDYLKVDPTVVRDLDLHLIKQEVVASVLHVADRLGCTVVAEGVETDGEAAALLRLGARFAQGYRFARPMPAPRDGRPASATGAEH